jgi:hypothetical protein
MNVSIPEIEAQLSDIRMGYSIVPPRDQKIAAELEECERNILRSAAKYPIMEADIGPAELQVRAVVAKGLLHWRPEGCVLTDHGRSIHEICEKRRGTP